MKHGILTRRLFSHENYPQWSESRLELIDNLGLTCHLYEDKYCLVQSAAKTLIGSESEDGEVGTAPDDILKYLVKDRACRQVMLFEVEQCLLERLEFPHGSRGLLGRGMLSHEVWTEITWSVGHNLGLSRLGRLGPCLEAFEAISFDGARTVVEFIVQWKIRWRRLKDHAAQEWAISIPPETELRNFVSSMAAYFPMVLLEFRKLPGPQQTLCEIESRIESEWFQRQPPEQDSDMRSLCVDEAGEGEEQEVSGFCSPPGTAEHRFAQ